MFFLHRYHYNCKPCHVHQYLRTLLKNVIYRSSLAIVFIPGVLGDPCATELDCSAAMSDTTCTGGVCACVAGHQQINSDCIKRT